MTMTRLVGKYCFASALLLGLGGVSLRAQNFATDPFAMGDRLNLAIQRRCVVAVAGVQRLNDTETILLIQEPLYGKPQSNSLVVTDRRLTAAAIKKPQMTEGERLLVASCDDRSTDEILILSGYSETIDGARDVLELKKMLNEEGGYQRATEVLPKNPVALGYLVSSLWRTSGRYAERALALSRILHHARGMTAVAMAQARITLSSLLNRKDADIAAATRSEIMNNLVDGILDGTESTDQIFRVLASVLEYSMSEGERNLLLDNRKSLLVSYKKITDSEMWQGRKKLEQLLYS